MKCLVNALGVSTGGGVRHFMNLLPALGQIDSKTHYVVYIRKTAPIPNCGNNFEFVRLSDCSATNFLLRNCFDLLKSPYLLKRENFDVTVSLTNFGPIWSPVKHIFVQQNPIYFSDWYLRNVPVKHALNAKIRSMLCFESMLRSEMIITPSLSMTRLLKNKYPRLEQRKIFSIYHGFSQSQYTNNVSPEIRQSLEFNGEKILYPTLFGFHKGFFILAKILLKLRQIWGHNFKVFVNIEKKQWPEIFELAKVEPNILENIHWLGPVSQDSMGYLYQNCDLMFYPSLLESFGFSMLEAMALGLPIVAADTEINREICGDGALFYSPFDADAGAGVLAQAFQLKEKDRLRKTGKLRYNSYDWSWERCAKEYMSVLF